MAYSNSIILNYESSEPSSVRGKTGRKPSDYWAIV